MKLTKLLRIMPLLFLGCVSSHFRNSLIGNYHTKGKDYAYNLILKRDSTFKLTIWDIEVKSDCEGKWKMIENDSIYLQCFPPNPSEQLQGGYMSDRQRKVAVINSRKLKMDNIEMKLVKE